MNIWQRIKYEAIKAVIEYKLKHLLGEKPMASPLTQSIITFITTFFTVGDATLGPISVTENLDIAGQKVAVTESITVELKKV
jgi:hypothetical protein